MNKDTKTKEAIKQRAEAVAKELGYDTSTISLNLINILDMYCMGYAFGLEESKIKYRETAIAFLKWKWENDWCEWDSFLINANTEEEKTHDQLFDLFLQQTEIK
jgi:hypothetical protein